MDKLTSFFDTAVTNMPIYRKGIISHVDLDNLVYLDNLKPQ